MAEKHDPSPGAPGEHIRTTINMQDDTETEKALADDTHSNEDDLEKHAKEEKEGSLKDYFVRGTSAILLGC